MLDEQLHRNRGYRDRYYSNLDIAPAADGYGLAGFPPEHIAWREEPWIHHAPPGCGNAPRSSMSNTCDEKTQSLGIKFLDEYQSKVKRQIFSGYQSDIDTHNRIKDEL